MRRVRWLVILLVSLAITMSLFGGYVSGNSVQSDAPNDLKKSAVDISDNQVLGVSSYTQLDKVAGGHILATADSENPDPVFLRSSAPDKISLGKTALIDVKAENRGGNGGSSSTISLSFPALDQSDDESHIEVRTNTFSTRRVRTAGDTLYSKSGDRMSANYALVEGGTGDGNWESYEENRLTIAFSPDQTGTYRIYIRATITDDDDVTEKFNAPSSSVNTDQQNYFVKELIIEVTDPKEEIIVHPEDEKGETPSTASALLVSNSDDRSRIKELSDSPDCTDCVRYTDSFVEPGEYTAYVKHNSLYWGWRETSVERGESSVVFFDRGGSWIRDVMVSTAETDSGTPRVAPRESIPLTVDVYQKNHGENAKIELFVHEEGTPKPETPTKTFSRSLYEGSNEFDFEITAPYNERTYTIDYSVDTYFPKLDGNRLTDKGEAATVRVEEYEPPQIETHRPKSLDSTVLPEETPEFSVSVTDDDTPLSDINVEWKVDGSQVASGENFELNPSDYDAGDHEVTALVSDGSSRTSDARQTWTITVAKAPEIEWVKPNEGTAVPGQPIDFEVLAEDPNNFQIAEYSWDIQGNHLAGKDVSYTFQKTGEFTAKVSVKNSKGVTTSKTFEIRVSGKKPRIESVDPTNRLFDVGESVDFGVKVTDPLDRDISFSYEWIIDGEKAFTTETGTQSFRSVGPHSGKVVVTNEYGVSTSKSFDFTVENDQPIIEPISPAEGSDTVNSKEPTQFTGQVSNQDKSDVTVSLKIDGEIVEQSVVKETSKKVSFRPQFQKPGDHTVALIAEDGHGASTSTDWDVQVKSQPPVFTDRSPSQAQITGLTPLNRTFSVDAKDPESQDVSYEWYLDGNYVSDGPRFQEEFTRHGTYSVTAKAIDPQDSSNKQQWTVDVDSFNVDPQVRKHSTETTVLTDQDTTTFLTVAMNNPKANNRTVLVEFVIELPDGLDINRLANVKSASAANAIGFGTLEPGEQKSMRVGVSVQDESLQGESVDVEYAVRYYPINSKTDYHTVLDKSTTLKIYEDEPKTTYMSSGDGTGSHIETTDTSAPDFTGLTTLIALVISFRIAVMRWV